MGCKTTPAPKNLPTPADDYPLGAALGTLIQKIPNARIVQEDGTVVNMADLLACICEQTTATAEALASSNQELVVPRIQRVTALPDDNPKCKGFYINSRKPQSISVSVISGSATITDGYGNGYVVPAGWSGSWSVQKGHDQRLAGAFLPVGGENSEILSICTGPNGGDFIINWTEYQ